MKQFYANEEEFQKDNEKMRKDIITEQQNTVKSLFHKKMFYVILIIIVLLVWILINNFGYLIGLNVNSKRLNFHNQIRMYNITINKQTLPNDVYYHERRDIIPLFYTYDTTFKDYFYYDETNLVPIMDSYELNIKNYKCYSKNMNNSITRCRTFNDYNLNIVEQNDDKYQSLQIKYEGKIIYDDKFITDLTPYLKESGTYELTIKGKYPYVKTTIHSEFVLGAKKEESENFMNKINIKINDQNFTATIYDNYAVRDLLELFPLNITMSDLNNNEKFYYLDKELTATPGNVNEIKKGDIMLYENNCIVIFYKDFTTHYPYTKLGYIDNPENLEEVLSNSDVNVTINIP